MRTDRLGTDRFLSSLGVTDLSWRTEATEGERDILVPFGVDGRECGVLRGVRAGEESSRVRVSGVFVVLLEKFPCTFPFLYLSLCGVVAFVAEAFAGSFDSTEGSAMSGSRSISFRPHEYEVFVY